MVISFLVNAVPNSSAFATPTHSMAAGTAFGALTECVKQGLAVGGIVTLWGPVVCR